MGLVFMLGIACKEPTVNKIINGPEKLNGTIKDLSNGMVKLLYEIGGEQVLFDSVKTNKSGSFTYQFQSGFQKGTCYASWGVNSSQKVRFIVDSEDVTFQAINNYIPNITFTDSPRNSAFQKYNDEKGVFFERLRVLGPVLNNYSQEDEFYNLTKKEFIKIQVDHDKMMDALIAQDTTSFLANYLESDRLPKLNPLLDLEEQNNWFFQHWFDHVDFENPVLLNSNLFGEKIFYHLSLAQSIAKSPEQQLQLFKSSINTILNKSLVNSEVYGYCVSNLISVFREAGNEILVDYILESHQKNKECSSVNLSDNLLNEIAALENIQIGSIAPNITGKTIGGEILQLNELSTKYVLVVFWSANCPHCLELLPKLGESLFHQNKSLEIYSFSVDKFDNSLKDFVDTNNLNFHVVYGEDTSLNTTLRDYAITGTPSMFLLNEKREIVSKPINYFDLIKGLKTLNVLK